jgi:hypothetical protein
MEFYFRGCQMSGYLLIAIVTGIIAKQMDPVFASAHKLEVNTPKRGPVYLDFMGK